MTVMTRAPLSALDPRLIIGVALVGASVAGVWAIVAAADETVAVYAASAALSVGDRIDAGDLEQVRVRLQAAYLYVDAVPAAGLVVTRSVGAGELLPLSATGSTDGLRLTSVVVSVGGPLSAAIAAGSVVDIWSSAQSGSGAFSAPTTIVAGATVVRLVQSQTIVGAGQTTAVEVLIPKSKVARVLQAVANDNAVSVVAATLPNP